MPRRTPGRITSLFKGGIPERILEGVAARIPEGILEDFYEKALD